MWIEDHLVRLPHLRSRSHRVVDIQDQRLRPRKPFGRVALEGPEAVHGVANIVTANSVKVEVRGI